MRFTHKFNNGAWKLFDTWEYRDVGIFGLEVDAIAARDTANSEAMASRRRN